MRKEKPAGINEESAPAGIEEGEAMPGHSLTEQERRALLALDYAAASAALEGEDPAALALVTEFILLYSEKAAEELKAGRDYLPLLEPHDNMPALERIALEMVLEGFEEELDSEY